MGVVGADWPAEYTELLNSRNIDTSGLLAVADGMTFTWTGRYHDNMNDRDTLAVELNVFGDSTPFCRRTIAAQSTSSSPTECRPSR